MHQPAGCSSLLRTSYGEELVRAKHSRTQHSLTEDSDHRPQEALVSVKVGTGQRAVMLPSQRGGAALDMARQADSTIPLWPSAVLVEWTRKVGIRAHFDFLTAGPEVVESFSSSEYAS